MGLAPSRDFATHCYFPLFHACSPGRKSHADLTSSTPSSRPSVREVCKQIKQSRQIKRDNCRMLILLNLLILLTLLHSQRAGRSRVYNLTHDVGCARFPT